MSKGLVKIGAVIFWSLITTSISDAEDKLTCLEKIAKNIKPGKEITILKTDGSQVSGRLHSTISEISVLVLQQYQSQTHDLTTFTIYTSDVEKIRWVGSGGHNYLCTLAGFVLGVYVAGGIFRDELEEDIGGGAAFVVVLGGGTLGLLVGDAVGSAIPKNREIKCK